MESRQEASLISTENELREAFAKLHDTWDFPRLSIEPTRVVLDFEEYDDILGKCKDENEVQRYLEKHGHLLPVNNWILGHQVHCAFIISKFKFGINLFQILHI